MNLLKKIDAERLINLANLGIEQLQGISAEVAQAVQLALTSIVTSGMPINKAIEEVAKVSGRLEQYAGAYINTTRTKMSQTVTDLNAEHYKENGNTPYFQYFGAVPDEKTREICLIGLGVNPDARFPNAPFFTEDEKIQFESEFGIRWNCRHEFNLITEAYYKNAIGE